MTEKYGAAPEDFDGVLDRVTYLDEPPPPDIPPPPSPDEPIMVVMSLRLPVEVFDELKAVAAARGTPYSRLVRAWIEHELNSLKDDQLVSRADVLRALAAVPPAER